jgi:hypothetical protein
LEGIRNDIDICDIPIDMALTLYQEHYDFLLGSSNVVQMLESILHGAIARPLVGARGPIEPPKLGIHEQEVIEFNVRRKRRRLVVVGKLCKTLVVLDD